jgi:hypothetical protein
LWGIREIEDPIGKIQAERIERIASDHEIRSRFIGPHHTAKGRKISRTKAA